MLRSPESARQFGCHHNQDAIKGQDFIAIQALFAPFPDAAGMNYERSFRFPSQSSNFFFLTPPLTNWRAQAQAPPNLAPFFCSVPSRLVSSRNRKRAFSFSLFLALSCSRWGRIRNFLSDFLLGQLFYPSKLALSTGCQRLERRLPRAVSSAVKLSN